MKTLNYVVAFVVVLFVAFVGSVVPADAQNLAQCVQIEDVPDRDTVFSFTNVCNDPIWVSWTHDGTYTPNGAELANWDERYRYGAHLLPGETQAYHMYHNPERGVNYLYCVEPGQIADIRNVCQNPREHERERLAYERRREEEARERLAAERRREAEAREEERLAAERRNATQCIDFQWTDQVSLSSFIQANAFTQHRFTVGNSCPYEITVYLTTNARQIPTSANIRGSFTDVDSNDWDLAWFDFPGLSRSEETPCTPLTLEPGADLTHCSVFDIIVPSDVDALAIVCANAADGEQTCLNQTPREMELLRP